MIKKINFRSLLFTMVALTRKETWSYDFVYVGSMLRSNLFVTCIRASEIIRRVILIISTCSIWSAGRRAHSSGQLIRDPAPNK